MKCYVSRATFVGETAQARCPAEDELWEATHQQLLTLTFERCHESKEQRHLRSYTILFQQEQEPRAHEHINTSTILASNSNHDFNS